MKQIKLNIIIPTDEQGLIELNNRCAQAGAFLVSEYLKKVDLTTAQKKDIVRGISKRVMIKSLEK